MADRSDIRISNNAAWAGTWTIEQPFGTARNLTGATFEMDIRSKAADADPPVATLTTANGRVTLSATPTDGRLSIEIPEDVADAMPVGLYFHDMIMTLGGVTERIWSGTIRVEHGVTRGAQPLGWLWSGTAGIYWDNLDSMLLS